MSALFCCGILVPFPNFLHSDRDGACKCKGFVQPLSSPVDLLLLATVLISI